MTAELENCENVSFATVNMFGRRRNAAWTLLSLNIIRKRWLIDASDEAPQHVPQGNTFKKFK